MTDIVPPPPGMPPPPPAQGPPNKIWLTVAGIGLFIGSVLPCYLFPPIGLVGLVGAIVSLFYPGYRCIFIGYIGTLGVLLLVAVIYCSQVKFD